jgi:DNA-binding NtrC family response regulator
MFQEATEYKTFVLVVEMDPMCRRVVERILKESCRIVTSCDYDEILTLLREKAFDTLFVDNDFPFPGVIQLFEKASRLSPPTKRILMTGEHVENLQYYLKVGLINDYVTRTTPSRIIEAAVTGGTAHT